MSEPTEARAGSRVGRYRLLRRIAIGGMAEVFLAENDRGERRVVKVLLPHHARDAETVKTLEREAKVAAQLAHDGLVRVFELGSFAGGPFLVMEHVAGTTLRTLLDAEPSFPGARLPGEPLPLPVVHYVARSLAATLAHVHEAKDAQGRSLAIVHRDVTPENVLLRVDGAVKLGDFGIARTTEGAGTRTGTVKGKLRYLSPEQATGSAIGARSDVYSLAMVVFEMLDGEPYLRGESDVELLRAAESPEPRAPKRGEPKLVAILARALARFPEERGSARALARELEALDDSGGRDQLAAWVRSTTPAEEEVVSSGSRAPMLALLAGIVAATGGVVWLGTNESSPPTIGPTERDAAPPPGDASPPLDVEQRTEARPASLDAEPDRSEVQIADAAKQRRIDAHRAAPRPDAQLEDAAAPASDAAAPVVDAQPLTRALDALRSRGIRREDLPREIQRRVRETERAIDAGTAQAQAIGTLARTLDDIVVDEALVQRKIERIDRLLRARPRSPELDELAAGALEELLAGRHDRANRRLEAILDRL